MLGKRIIYGEKNDKIPLKSHFHQLTFAFGLSKKLIFSLKVPILTLFLRAQK